MSQTTQCLPNCLFKSSRNDSKPLLVRFHHTWLVDNDVWCARGVLLSVPPHLCLVRHGVEQRARRLKLVWRYAHSEFTWNTAPMAPGNSPCWLIPRWDSLTLSGEGSELCEWQYTQVVTRPYPITQFLTLFTFVRPVTPLITTNHIYTWSIRWSTACSTMQSSWCKFYFLTRRRNLGFLNRHYPKLAENLCRKLPYR